MGNGHSRNVLTVNTSVTNEVQPMNIDRYIRFIAESIDREDAARGLCETRVEGRRYDWSEDFEFTGDVISDLKRRDMFGIGVDGIYAMVPINRENAPNYYGPKQFNYRKDKDGNWKDGKEPDFESYDILHISLTFDTDQKKMVVGRYFGHRLDWSKENHTSTEKDWTDIPVLSRKTIQSLIDAYKDNGVFDKMKANLEEYAKKHREYLDKYVGTPEREKERLSGLGDHDIQKALERLFKRRGEQKTTWSKYMDVCNCVIDGSYRSFAIEMDYPEVPSEKEIRDRYERHRKFADATDRALADYYDTHQYTGD